MSCMRHRPPGRRVWTSRALLIALLGAFHFVAVPCAMAAADGPDCGHCGDVANLQPCLSAAGDTSAGQPGPAMEDSRLPARSPVSSLVVPAWGAATATAAVSRAVALHTGRHTGDPPYRLRFGNLRI